MKREMEAEGRMESLGAIRDFVEAACRCAGADNSVCFDVKLAVDEACTNIVEHGYEGGPAGTIGVRIEDREGALAVTITDRGRTFIPERIPEADLTSEWEDRPAGGLGWHLIRRTMDEIDYRRDADGTNRLVLVKRLRPASDG
jgi:serine/threonine-protein kinase RsbW